PRDGARGPPPPPPACLGAGGALGRRLPRGVLRHAVVLRGVSTHAARAQLLLRRGPVGLLEPRGAVAISLLAQRHKPGHAPLAAARRARRRGLRSSGAVVGKLDGAAAA